MREWTIGVAVAAVALWGGNASAVQYPMGAGKWEVTFQADQPVTGYLEIEVNWEYVAESVETGQVVSWGGAQDYYHYDFDEPTTFGTILFRVPRTYTLYYYMPGVGQVREGHPSNAVARFRSHSGPATISYERVGDVPEPASWALMILGLGAAGAALRHRPAMRPTA